MLVLIIIFSLDIRFGWCYCRRDNNVLNLLCMLEEKEESDKLLV